MFATKFKVISYYIQQVAVLVFMAATAAGRRLRRDPQYPFYPHASVDLAHAINQYIYSLQNQITAAALYPLATAYTLGNRHPDSNAITVFSTGNRPGRPNRPVGGSQQVHIHTSGSGTSVSAAAVATSSRPGSGGHKIVVTSNGLGSNSGRPSGLKIANSNGFSATGTRVGPNGISASAVSVSSSG